MTKVMIIAELSGNHNNDLQYAKDSLYAIKETGADAVKLQTYTADSLTLNVKNDEFGPRKDGIWKGRTPYEVFSEGSLPYEWHSELFDYAKELDLLCFSSPFDEQAVEFLESLNNPIYKVASFEINHIPLIEKIAETNKPVIISTGIAKLNDIELAISYFDRKNVTLLKCTSAYPAPYDEINLRAMPTLGDIFGVEFGISDHTIGSAVPIAAVAMGASIIEKHFILDPVAGGVDADFSMSSVEFKDMVTSIRLVERALGKKDFSLTEASKKARLRSRSIYFCESVSAGDTLTRNNMRVVRGGAGVHSKYFNQLLGCKVKSDTKMGDPLILSNVFDVPDFCK
ncbi:MAG: pseudaminic acid synthase [Proteobacteria bacterium]|nr:pseudaminic acid synthase [Pseudomonadota bacterium]